MSDKFQETLEQIKQSRLRDAERKEQRRREILQERKDRHQKRIEQRERDKAEILAKGNLTTSISQQVFPDHTSALMYFDDTAYYLSEIVRLLEEINDKLDDNDVKLSDVMSEIRTQGRRTRASM